MGRLLFRMPRCISARAPVWVSGLSTEVSMTPTCPSGSWEGTERQKKAQLHHFPKLCGCEMSGPTTAESHTHRILIPCTSDLKLHLLRWICFEPWYKHLTAFVLKTAWMGFINIHNYELVSLSVSLSVYHLFMYHLHKLPIAYCWLALEDAKQHFIFSSLGTGSGAFCSSLCLGRNF